MNFRSNFNTAFGCHNALHHEQAHVVSTTYNVHRAQYLLYTLKCKFNILNYAKINSLSLLLLKLSVSEQIDINLIFIQLATRYNRFVCDLLGTVVLVLY